MADHRPRPQSRIVDPTQGCRRKKRARCHRLEQPRQTNPGSGCNLRRIHSTSAGTCRPPRLPADRTARRCPSRTGNCGGIRMARQLQHGGARGRRDPTAGSGQRVLRYRCPVRATAIPQHPNRMSVPLRASPAIQEGAFSDRIDSCPRTGIGVPMPQCMRSAVLKGPRIAVGPAARPCHRARGDCGSRRSAAARRRLPAGLKNDGSRN